MKITSKEIESVSKLSPFERYNYFIKRVADFEIIYTLVDGNNGLAIADIENKSLLSFWSAEEYAILNAVNEWKDYKPKKITLEEFEDSFIDLIIEKEYLLNIFPMNNKTGFVVNVHEFARDLASEMEKYG